MPASNEGLGGGSNEAEPPSDRNGPSERSATIDGGERRDAPGQGVWHRSDFGSAARAHLKHVLRRARGGSAKALAARLFDATHYREEAARIGLPAPEPGTSLFEHWLAHGRAARVTPTPHFDEALYRRLYPDVEETGAWGFEHFLLHGAFEHRSPNRVFDSRWYAHERAASSALPPFVDYIVREPATAPSAAIEEMLAEAGLLGQARDAALELELASRRLDLSEVELDLCIDLVRVSHDRNDPNAAGPWPTLVALLEGGLTSGRSPTPLFDEAFYREEWSGRGLPGLTVSEATFFHWLKAGRRRQVIFSPYFDGDFYLRNNPEAGSSAFEGFLHFISRGIGEARDPNPLFDSKWYDKLPGVRPGLASFVDYIRFGAARGRLPSDRASEILDAINAPPDTRGLGPAGLAMQRAVCKRLWAIDEMRFLAETLVPIDSEGRPLPRAVALRRCLESDPAPSPTPLFVRDLYEQCADGGSVDDEDNLAPRDFRHWLRHGRTRGAVPTVLFDPRYYERTYEDLGPAASRNYDHFLVNGVKERRDPSPWFHSHWYAHRYGCAPSERPYYTFLTSGISAGHLPSPSLQVLLQRYGEGSERLTPGDFERLNIATAKLYEGVTQEQLHSLILAFEAHSYLKIAELPRNTAVLSALAHFLETGLAAGLPPTPFFDAEFYSEELDRIGGGRPGKGQPAFWHWLTVGKRARVTPTRSFSESYYLSTYNDIASAGVWGFDHFVSHGLHEGRLPYDLLDVPTPGIRLETAALATIQKAFPDLRLGADAKSTRSHSELATTIRASVGLTQGAAFREIIRRAQHLEPAVGDLGAKRTVLRPPHHDPKHLVIRDILDLLPQTTCDFVVCVPWVRMGGADYVGSVVTQSLLRLRPEAKVLVLQTDASLRDWIDWYPDPASVVDISGPLQSCGPVHAEFILYTVMMGMGPQGVINVNSNSCWRMFGRYGERLRRSMKLWSYLFCWDQTAEGARVGYPSRFFPETVALLDGTLTDTHYLRDELRRIYRVPDAYARRIRCLSTPATLKAANPPIVDLQLDRDDTPRRSRIVWAGRFDRQKRFDLLVAVASAMPDVDFDCWGASVIGDDSPISDLPANLRLRGAFKTYDELELVATDGWLYTAAWDGLPTILIELAMLGVPIVASAVGGVPELITQSTGWPVEAADDPSAYVSALRSMLSNPRERQARARALQDLALSRHTTSEFDRALLGVLTAETER